MSSPIQVPFSRLVLYHGEIGIHRGRRAGFRDVFGFRTLRDLPFSRLAEKVKRAYEGKKIPPHDGWPAQHEALRWFVEQGRDALYAREGKPIRVCHTPYRQYYILDGHHRALALFVLGESTLTAVVDSSRPMISVGRRMLS